MKNYQSVWTLVALLGFNNAKAQFQPLDNHDHLLAARGSSMITVATGIPYIGITEFAYGFTDGFSAGVIVGKTPMVPGYGVRVRGVLIQRENKFRLYLRAPVFYYPQTKGLGGEPWYLTWPVMSSEWKLANGTRLSLGGGVVAAVCAHSLLGHTEEGEGFMGGVWNTLHGGVAVPLGKNLMLQSEISAVMSGLKIAGKDWVGGPPVIVVLGLSYSLF